LSSPITAPEKFLNRDLLPPELKGCSLAVVGFCPFYDLGILGIWLDFAGSGLPETSPVQPDRIIQALAVLVSAKVGE